MTFPISALDTPSFVIMWFVDSAFSRLLWLPRGLANVLGDLAETALIFLRSRGNRLQVAAYFVGCGAAAPACFVVSSEFVLIS